jgi:outer membrane protein OmpA-like peptidoglycan-associated protein
MKQIIQLLFSIIIFTTGQLSAQEQLEVQRCADIDRSAAIKNIFIDRDNNKWVADAQGLFLAQSPDFAKTIEGKTGQWNLLSAPDGNKELYFPKGQLEEIIGMDVNQITCASINKEKELWIGTADKGLFLLNTKNGLSLLKNLSSSNSKLRSNTIQAIFITKEGQLLAATDDGLFSKNENKESLFSKGYDFTAIANNKGIIWVIADGEVLEMGKKGDLFETEFDERMFDGKPVDIDFDRKGNLWIASEVVVRYHFELESFDFFGPAEDFTSQSVKCIAADSDGALWVGTENKGVFYIGKSSSLSGVVQVTEYLDCTNGAKNAALEVRASGGEPPYTYQWNQGLVGETPKNLGPGTYTVTITDQKGKKATAEVIIKESTFTVEVRQLKEAALGGGKDGSAVVEINGGNGTFIFAWDSGETTATALQLPAGEHRVTISETNGCVTTATVSIKEKLGELSVNLEQTEVIVCAGSKNGSLKAAVSGGQAPYKYQWMGASGFTEAATNLGAGEYKVVVTDSNNNTTVSEVTIEEPKALIATAKVKSPATANNADGKASVKGAGGTGNKYQYKWDTGETESTASKLALGTHTVTVTDDNGCTATSNIEITEDILPLSVSLESSGGIKCVGDNTAALKVDISGGKSPFTYQWSSVDVTGESASNLSAGDYSLTITDASGTTAIANAKIKDPSPLEIELKVKSPATANNADGKASVKGAGGAGNKYQYKWDTGETESTASKLALGTHTATVTDENGCTVTSNIEITEDILPLSVSLESSASIKCVGDNTAALKVDISGGKSPFTYQWNSGEIKGESASNLSAGDYSLTVTDVSGTTAIANAKIKSPNPLEVSLKVEASATTNNSDGKASASVKGGTGKYSYTWDNNENTIKASKLAPGNHKVVVTDENGCTATANIEITENILPLSLSIKQTASINCHGEKTAALEVNVQGGKTPFDFKWNQANVNGDKATQLGGGNYELTLTDASGLSQTASLRIEEPEVLMVAINKNIPATNENSKDGKVSLNVSGGTPPYSYIWDSKETTEAAAKLPIGNHSVTVSDANACSAILQVETKKKILEALTAGRLKQGQTLQVSNLYFEADSTNMTPASYPTLSEIATFLKDNPLVVIEVGGHTNNIPAPEFCDALSTARAKAVTEFVVKEGIDKNRVLYKGYGKREPKYSNNHKEGRAKNQRVEIKILSLQ